MNYGKELILDLHDCDIRKMTKPYIGEYFDQICKKIDMVACDRHYWESTEEERAIMPPHTIGISAIQFILTSNITIHTLDILKSVYVNIFSCKEFDTVKAVQFTKEYFGGKEVNRLEVGRI